MQKKYLTNSNKKAIGVYYYKCVAESNFFARVSTEYSYTVGSQEEKKRRRKRMLR